MGHFGGGAGSRTRFQTRVWLHVYDLSPANDFLYSVGMGLHHSGIEIMGVEYSFASGAGIYESHTPSIVDGAKHRERLDLGSFDGGSDRLKKVIDELKDMFGPSDYNIIRRNCNHFANALTWKLLQRQIPSHVNRLSDLAQCLSCLIPKKLLENAPVGDPNNDTDKETSSFLAQSINKNRTNTSSATTAFAGTGRTLAADGPALNAASGTGGGLLSRFASSSTTAGGSSLSPKDDLVDRREKIRQAALARMERSQVPDQGGVKQS